MSEHPLVSIIVPIYKVESYLIQCLESILAQTLKEIEVLLVDEGDWDACYAIMKLFEERDSRVKIIHKKCGGYGAACNLAIEAAQGEYIGIVESDDFIEPTMYEEMYKRAKELDADVLKTPFYYYWDASGREPACKKICEYRDWITKKSPEGTFSIQEHPEQMAVHASVWSGLYKRAFMEKKNVRFVAAKGAGYVDVEFRIRTLCEAQKLAWLNKPFYNYRCTNATSSTNTFNLTAMLGRWKEAHDYFDRQDPSLYKTVGPYLFIDEYLNTAAFFFLRALTDQQFKQLKENLARIDDDIIKNAYGLNESQKKRVLAIKKYETKAQVQAHTVGPRLLRLLSHALQFNIFFKRTLFKVHLCSGLGRCVFSASASFFGIFTVLFVLGKEKTRDVQQA